MDDHADPGHPAAVWRVRQRGSCLYHEPQHVGGKAWRLMVHESREPLLSLQRATT